MNERGQYGPSSANSTTEGQRWRRFEQTWGEGRSRAFQRSMAVSAIGSVAGAVLWKEHRVWGFILGGMGGGAVGNLVFSPPEFSALPARP